jgi:hypothetical protein
MNGAGEHAFAGAALAAEQHGRFADRHLEREIKRPLDCRFDGVQFDLRRELADCYAHYELKEEEVKTLQDEILDVQGILLRSYHSMQKELRVSVGPERFLILSNRIDNALRNPPPQPPKK